MKYWQHGETGICRAVNDNIDLSRRHFEITKEQYELHESAKNTEQQLQPENVLPVCWNENCPKWSEDICQSPDKCIEDVSG